MVTGQNPRQTYKALLFDYDALLAASDDECCFSLSEREILILLAQIEYIGWKTRYIATETEIDPITINRWRDNLARKLMSGCCPDDGRLSRFTEDGIYQTSDDGGETWEDNPQADPRNQATQAPPLGGSGDSTRCAAADNVRDTFKAYKATVRGLLEAGTTVLAIVAGLIGALGLLLGLSVAGLGISVLLFGMAAALLSLTPEELDDALSDEVFDEFRCLVYCAAEDDGTFTYSAWVDLIGAVDDTFSGFPEQFFHAILAAMGYIGLCNAATTGVATADDCDDCDCPATCGDPALITIGNVIESGIESGHRYLIVESEVYAGSFSDVSWQTFGNTSPPAILCFITSIETLSGSGVHYGWTDAGGGIHDPSNPAGAEVSHFYAATNPGNTSPFTIKVVF